MPSGLSGVIIIMCSFLSILASLLLHKSLLIFSPGLRDSINELRKFPVLFIATISASHFIFSPLCVSCMAISFMSMVGVLKNLSSSIL